MHGKVGRAGKDRSLSVIGMPPRTVKLTGAVPNNSIALTLEGLAPLRGGQPLVRTIRRFPVDPPVPCTPFDSVPRESSECPEVRRRIEEVVSGVVDNAIEASVGLDADHLVDAAE